MSKKVFKDTTNVKVQKMLQNDKQNSADINIINFINL